MPPRIGRQDEPVRVNHHPPRRTEADNQQQQIPKRTVENSTARKGELQAQAQQRRERLERLIPAGTASVGMINDARLLRAANRADKAWVAAHQKAQQEFERVQPTIKTRAEEIAKSNKRDNFNMDDYRQAVAEYRKNTGYTGATDAVEVSRHADASYREVLASEGFKATDVRGDSVSKAADFMLKRADDAKPFSVLYDGEVKSRVAENKPAGDYMVRIVKRTFMTDPNARLTNSEKAWMALPDEAAGAKLNARGIMNHVGYDGATIHSP
ncbi:MAG TPA: hypothetical protein VNI84_15675, partial [Pyrinomonadaceae bacterium]|nr:hypothetical protein [Pyrinomonadaceae bacterium]